MSEGKLILEQVDGNKAEIVIEAGATYTEYVKAFYTLMSFATFPESVHQDILGVNPWDWE